MAVSRAKHWCFTLNNPTEDEYRNLRQLYSGGSGGVTYICLGRETGDSGTPHIQGFVSFGTRKRFHSVKTALGDRVHLEVARGTPKQASDYCKKDGNFTELGTIPTGQGKRSDIDHFKTWVFEYYTDHNRRPTEREIAIEHSSLWMRYPERIMSLRDMLLPPQRLVSGTLNDWQQDVYDEISEGTWDDRQIRFICDPDGGKGKSWFCRYVKTNMPEKTQLLSIGKRDDIAYCIDPSCSIFLFNVPRGQMEFLRYEILEMMKDRVVFSPKYNSSTKYLEVTPYVAVFSNEMPDMNKMTSDRYNVTHLY